MRHTRSVAARRPSGRRGRARVTALERAAFHEAGHVVGWLSAPVAPPHIDAITIEPDRLRQQSGEVRLRRPRDEAGRLRLAVGRALSRGNLGALTPLLADLSAEVRAHAAGPVAEAMRLGVPLRAIEEGECDYWNAYELALSMGLEPERSWRSEAGHARKWLRRHWGEVEHLAAVLLCRPAGRRVLAGAAMSSLIARALAAVRSPFDTPYYASEARRWLAQHRARWRAEHWVVLEARRPRSAAVAWADDARSAASIATELERHLAAGTRLSVERRTTRRG